MQIVKTTSGRPARIGRVDFVGNKMYFFAGYQNCPDCRNKLKLLIPKHEAEILCSLFVHRRNAIAYLMYKEYERKRKSYLNRESESSAEYY